MTDSQSEAEKDWTRKHPRENVRQAAWRVRHAVKLLQEAIEASAKPENLPLGLRVQCNCTWVEGLKYEARLNDLLKEIEKEARNEKD